MRKNGLQSWQSGEYLLFLKWLSSKGHLFTLQEISSGVNLIKSSSVCVIGVEKGYVGQCAWRTQDVLSNEANVNTIVVTDFFDWRVYVNGTLTSETRTLPDPELSGSWSPPAETVRFLHPQKSPTSGNVKASQTLDPSNAIVKQWVSRLNALRVILAQGLVARPSLARDKRLASNLDALLWEVVLLMFRKRLEEAACGIRKNSITYLYLAATKHSKQTSIEKRAWNLLAKGNKKLESIKVKDSFFCAIAYPFVSAGAGPLLAQHLGFIYEEALAHRPSSHNANPLGAREMQRADHFLMRKEIGEKSRSNVSIQKHKTKREQGIYYTPSDVVSFMCERALESSLATLTECLNATLRKGREPKALALTRLHEKIVSITILDPSVGGGEFLRQAMMRLGAWYRSAFIKLKAAIDDPSALPTDAHARFDLVMTALSRPLTLCLQSNLYGLDLDCSAVNFCKLNLVSQAAEETNGDPRLWTELLRSANKNIRLADTIAAATDRLAHVRGFRLGGRAAFKRRNQTAPRKVDSIEFIFPQVFSSAEKGFSVILSNPPYRRLSPAERTQAKSRGYQSADAGDIYALFVEASLSMLADHDAGLAVIVPLSVAFSEGFASLRQILIEKPREITACHFDNIPDTIFKAGKPENENTNLANSQRATILLFRPVSGLRGASIFSTDLLRWRTSERSQLFSRLTFADVSNIWSIDKGIPKVGDTWTAQVLSHLLDKGMRIRHMSSKEGPDRLFLPSTARYFISAVTASLGRSGEIDLYLDSPHAKAAAMVGLNSSMFYWFWRVFGDGFHVTRRTILDFPLPPEWLADQNGTIQRLAERLERVSGLCTVQKLNAGKHVLNVNFDLRPELILEIDKLYLSAFGISTELVSRFSRYKYPSFLSEPGLSKKALRFVRT